MADKLSIEKRSWNMSRIKNKDTSIEVAVRKQLFADGFRYRKNDSHLPGKPDIVLPKYHTVVFIHGCFWHRHTNCKNATMPKTRVEFWDEKFKKNVENDKKHYDDLSNAGWNVIIVWECEIEKNFHSCIQKLEKDIRAGMS